ncbi:MAG: methyltransferase domain-containing protein, partial [Micrococcales bacterium]|nr:methyltransferase domain-containing protein [Micrococcales bacterium]
MDQHELDARIQRYYAAHAAEDRRLTSRHVAGQVELTRVRRLVGQRLAPESTVLDVGGATGVHARWLAAQGHRVTLVDPVPEQVA